jgi:CheY-like chemotaxis protein
MSKRILIIDDERDMHIYLRTLLTRAGYEIKAATSGEEGLELMRSFKPDLITLDILMPRRSGIKAYQVMREAPAWQKIPVIFLTGLTNHEELLREIEGLPPPELIVEKPIDREDFLRRVGEILGGRS